MEITKKIMDKLNESSKRFRDMDPNDGIRTYYELIYFEEPQSEYDKLIKQYMNMSDEADDMAESGDIDSADTLMQQAIEVLHKADSIPEEDRGPLWKEYLDIDKANDDEFAQQRGYKTFNDYLNAGLK